MSIEPTWMKVVRGLGRPPWQRIDEWWPNAMGVAPGDAPATPGAQAARWATEIDRDLKAGRITRDEAERRKHTVVLWLARN